MPHYCISAYYMTFYMRFTWDNWGAPRHRSAPRPHRGRVERSAQRRCSALGIFNSTGPWPADRGRTHECSLAALVGRKHEEKLFMKYLALDMSRLWTCHFPHPLPWLVRPCLKAGYGCLNIPPLIQAIVAFHHQLSVPHRIGIPPSVIPHWFNSQFRI